MAGGALPSRALPGRLRPDDRLRGSVDGFPAWPPVGDPPLEGQPDPSQVLDRALAWLTAHVPWFGPKWDEFFPQSAFPGVTVLELLLLCRVLRRGPRAAASADLVEAAPDVAQEMAERPAFLGDLYRADADFAHRVWLLALLHGLGRPVSDQLAVARGLVEARGSDVSVVDWAMLYVLELRYILDMAEIPHSLPTVPELYAGCGVHRIDPLSTTENEGYVLAHALLYATALGGRPLPSCGGPTAERRLRDVLHTLLGVHLATDHYDLTAELLMCAEIAGGVSDGLVRHAWHRLAAAQRSDGSVPGPPFQEAVLAERTDAAADAYAFRTCYHTTLVTALAAAERECSRRRRGQWRRQCLRLRRPGANARRDACWTGVAGGCRRGPGRTLAPMPLARRSGRSASGWPTGPPRPRPRRTSPLPPDCRRPCRHR
ncbi:DUF6895 family protein [Nocardiopsis rhodophaea]|uniref:DUF6895 family protein n=1 Tax=Nocardiopsis rhodophaea TaxID=280238 RepID=UPI0031D54601